MTTDTSKKILAFIRTNKQAKAVDLIRNIGITNAAMHRQLNKLLARDAIVKIGKPPIVFYTLKEKGTNRNTREAVLEEIKNDVLPILLKADVTKAALFGSYVRGDNTIDSDIDILVDLPRGKSLFDLVELQDNLEEKLKKKVDIVTYNGINPYVKDYILQYQYPVL